MARKKPANWDEIKRRYIIDGEKPNDIAKSYNISAKTISNAAWEEGWEAERGKIRKELWEISLLSRKALVKEAYAIYTKAFEVIKKYIDQTENPLLFDGEGRINLLFMEPMKVAGKMVLDETGGDEEVDPPGINVSLDPDA